MRTGDEFVEDARTTGYKAAGELEDPVLDSALRGFRESVHAWSEAAYQRPRNLVAPAPRLVGRRAAAWVLCSALTFAIVGIGAYEQHHRQELAHQAALRQAQHERAIAAQRARETEDLLAQVDKDVSQEVPSAMEPLAQLMTDGDGK